MWDLLIMSLLALVCCVCVCVCVCARVSVCVGARPEQVLIPDVILFRWNKS